MAYTYTYATLVQDIQDWTENDFSEFTGEVDSFIRNAELRIVRETDLDVFRKTSTATLNVDDRYLSKPSDFVYDRWLKVTSGSNVTDVLPKDTSFLWTAYPDDTATGLPRYYSDFDNTTFMLGPVPDSAYTVTLGYIYLPDGLSSSNTTTWIGTNAPDVLLYACLVEAIGYMKGMEHPDLQYYEKRYTEARSGLKLNQEFLQRHEAGRYTERGRK